MCCQAAGADSRARKSSRAMWRLRARRISASFLPLNPFASANQGSGSDRSQPSGARSAHTDSKPLARHGVGAVTAAQLLVTAGANPSRLRGDAALAALCGASPVQASSGKTSRHRLNRGGDRAANNALWVSAHVGTISDPRTRAFVAKRTATGNSRREIMRMLQRYIGRELYPLIIDALRTASITDLT
jgi:hypothetical protein